MYGNIKALLGLRLKRLGRVLVPFAAGCAALNAPFFGRGQSVDDMGGSAGVKKGWFRCNELGDRWTARRCDIGGAVPDKYADQVTILVYRV